MNEQEAIEQLQGEYLATNGAETPARVRYHNEALDTAIAALNEVQEYHATGRTPSMVRALQVAYIRAKKRLDKYIAIGTPEQCKEAIYNQMRLPVNNQEGDSYYFLTGNCPVCGFRMIDQAATKADIIRRMPEEELARFLCEITGPCRNCLAKRCCGAGQNGFLDWLKEEVNAKD